VLVLRKILSIYHLLFKIAYIRQKGVIGMLGRMMVAVVATFAINALLYPAEAQTPQPFSDNFTRDKTLESGWTLSQPNPESHHSIGASGLLLESSGENGGSDFWSGTNFNASLLLQPISPENNWTIITHFCFHPVIDFQAAGIVLTEQLTGFTYLSRIHRFELSYQNVHDGLAVSSYTIGPIDPNFAPYSIDEIYLKLKKIGFTYYYSYSATGKQWTLVSTIIDTSPYRYVGLDSIRQPWHGGPALDSRPTFKSFNTNGEVDPVGMCARPIS
jgi:hypothetical protein